MMMAATAVLTMLVMVMLLMMMAATAMLPMLVMVMLLMMMAAAAMLTMLVMVMLLMMMAAAAMMFFFLMVMMMVMFLLQIQQMLFQFIFTSHSLQQLLATKLRPGSSHQGCMVIMLPDQGNGSIQLSLGDIVSTGKDDRTRSFDLVVVELAKVLHVDFNLGCVRYSNGMAHHHILR